MTGLLLLAPVLLSGPQVEVVRESSAFREMGVTSASVALVHAPPEVREGVRIRTKRCILAPIEGERLLEAIVAGRGVELRGAEADRADGQLHFLLRFKLRDGRTIVAVVPRVGPDAPDATLVRFNGGYVLAPSEPLARVPAYAAKRGCGIQVRNPRRKR